MIDSNTYKKDVVCVYKLLARMYSVKVDLTHFCSRTLRCFPFLHQMYASHAMTKLLFSVIRNDLPVIPF